MSTLRSWKELKKEYWGQNVIVDTQEWGYIDFSPQGMKQVFGGEKLTYEEYLDAQMASREDLMELKVDDIPPVAEQED